MLTGKVVMRTQEKELENLLQKGGRWYNIMDHMDKIF